MVPPQQGQQHLHRCACRRRCPSAGARLELVLHARWPAAEMYGVQTSRGGPAACCARPHCACVAVLTPAACMRGHASARQAAGGSDRAGEQNVAVPSAGPAGQDGLADADAQAAKGWGKCKEKENEEGGEKDGKEEEDGKDEEEEDEDNDKDAADDSERRDRDRHRQQILKSQYILTSCRVKTGSTDF
jgi:hypothetical protein